MSEIPVIHINCWPAIEHPFTLDERDDHDMRVAYCQQKLLEMSDEQRAFTDTPEGWSAFLKEHWDYNPEGYVKPVVTKEQREERRNNQTKKRFYVVDRSK